MSPKSVPLLFLRLRRGNESIDFFLFSSSHRKGTEKGGKLSHILSIPFHEES